MRAVRIAIAAIAALIAISAAPARAEFPSRTVKMIVPYPPGGGTDLLARVLADQLGRKWGQSVIVENVGGAGGNVGAEEVARAAPDGHTLLFASPGPLATNAFMYKTMPYDPAKWVPIAVVPWSAGSSGYQLRIFSRSSRCRVNLAAKGASSASSLSHSSTMARS